MSSLQWINTVYIAEELKKNEDTILKGIDINGPNIDTPKSIAITCSYCDKPFKITTT